MWHKDVPNPGSEAAFERGCTCPRMDNCNGRGIPNSADPRDNIFWVNESCPMHSEPSTHTLIKAEVKYETYS